MDPYPKAADLLPCLALASPLVALAVNTVAQILLLRSSRGAHFMRSMVGGFLIGTAFLAVMELMLLLAHSESSVFSLADIAVHVLTYVALSYCYFNFVNLGQSSIRIRIYAEIAASPNGLSIPELTRGYNESALMVLRLHRLSESGDIVKRNDRFFVGRRRLVIVAKIIFSAKWILLSKSSEFN